MTSPSPEREKLSDQERIALFTLLQQWSRNQDIQAQKVTEWIEARTEAAVREAVRDCANTIQNWRDSDGNGQFEYTVMAAALRQKYGVEPYGVLLREGR